MILKELPFVLKGGTNSLVAVNVPLTTVYDRNIAQAQRNDPSCKDIDDIRTLVPKRLTNELGDE